MHRVKVVFLYKQEGKVERFTDVISSDLLPVDGDYVKVPRERKVRRVNRQVYIFGKRGLLRIEVLLGELQRRII